MVTVIMMAKHYRKRPSEILNIDNDYLAFMFDRVAIFLENEATTSNGDLNWNKLAWEGERKEGNKELINFIKQGR